MGQAFIALAAALFPVLLVVGLLGAVVTADQKPPVEAVREMPANQGGYVLLSRLQQVSRRPAS